MNDWCLYCPYNDRANGTSFCLFVAGTCYRLGKRTIAEPLKDVKTINEMRAYKAQQDLKREQRAVARYKAQKEKENGVG